MGSERPFNSQFDWSALAELFAGAARGMKKKGINKMKYNILNLNPHFKHSGFQVEFTEQNSSDAHTE